MSAAPTRVDPTSDVIALVVAVLGDDLVGAYLHGSAVHGGLRASSDVDLLAVSRRSLTRGERVTLVAGIMERSGSRARGAPARPVELTAIVHGDVVPWRYPPVADFQYGEWLRDDYEAGLVPERETSPDLAPLLTMVLQGGAAVVGPPPSEVLDAVPASDLRRAIVAGVPSLLEDLADDTRNVLLTFARIWVTLGTGQVVSKDAAADWVLERLPEEHRDVLRSARDGYLGVIEDTWADRAAVEAHASYVVAQIDLASRA